MSTSTGEKDAKGRDGLLPLFSHAVRKGFFSWPSDGHGAMLMKVGRVQNACGRPEDLGLFSPACRRTVSSSAAWAVVQLREAKIAQSDRGWHKTGEP